MLPALKRLALRALTFPGATRPLRPLLRGRATIFMLHRFTDPARGIEAHAPEDLRQALAWLRRERVPLVPLPDIFGERAPALPAGATAFTIDDGYLEQATIAAPVFTEFDCPVTTFLTSGFLDRTLWFWWDRIEFVFQQTTHRSLDLTIGDSTVRHAWQNDAGRLAAQRDVTERCKLVPDGEKHATIARLAVAAEVALPDSAPERYAPMSWDQARACERQTTMRFGPHTVTHPILSQTPDAQSRIELTDSWRRLREELGEPVPIFCYPNGGPEDFGSREIETMVEIGLAGAVVGTPGYAVPRVEAATREGRFRVRRFSMPSDVPHVVHCAGGVERLVELAKGGAA
ncbi:MAG: polysaccharide deacetylase family protein [Gemmatimonadota bacterium]|nr:polysaccharide deacetylase family protein [Gemmatimonadota bacterium]